MTVPKSQSLEKQQNSTARPRPLFQLFGVFCIVYEWDNLGFIRSPRKVVPSEGLTVPVRVPGLRGTIGFELRRRRLLKASSVSKLQRPDPWADPKSRSTSRFYNLHHGSVRISNCGGFYLLDTRQGLVPAFAASRGSQHYYATTRAWRPP